VETPDLTSARYWESDEVDIRLNPRRSIDATGLRAFLEDGMGVRRAVVLATSGSSGAFKFAVLAKEALLASARAVVDHLELTGDDTWLAGLSDFHVGGLGIHARAFVTGARVEQFEAAPWRRDGGPFVEALENAGATWTSLTPTHLHDLVTAGRRAPRPLRGVLVGGGRVDAGLAERAVELGWPVRASYGMTEAASQIATARDVRVEPLPILPAWETRIGAEERLEIRGHALFSGYARREGDGWRFDPATDADGWFRTGDRCEVSDGRLRFLGRADDLVKVSGELVSRSSVEAAVELAAGEFGTAAALVVRPEARRGNEMVAVLETGAVSAEAFRAALEDRLDGIERVRRVVEVERVPRTEIGKVDRAALERLVGPAEGGV